MIDTRRFTRSPYDMRQFLDPVNWPSIVFGRDTAWRIQLMQQYPKRWNQSIWSKG